MIKNKLEELQNNVLRTAIGLILSETDEKTCDDSGLSKIKEFNQFSKKPFGEDHVLGEFESVKANIIQRREMYGDVDLSVANIRSLFLGKHNKEAIAIAAEYLIEKYNIKTVGNKENTKEMYVYMNGVYQVDYGMVIKEILEIVNDTVSGQTRNEILKYIKEKTYVEREYFSVDKNLINFENGVFDLESRTLHPSSPIYPFTNQIPVKYNENAECPTINKFLNEILDEESIKVIQEWFGYCLYRSYFIKKAIIFLGEKDTGKTTWIRVCTEFLGQDNVSGISLQKIGADRFASSSLHGKHANIYDDLSFKDINDNGVFKMITGGGYVSTEKKFGDQFTFKNHAKLTFACNKIPEIKDVDDDAYFGRWILIRFENKPEKIDKFLFEKMSTEEEMSGLLNFALEGLHRILEKQDFSYDRTPEEIKKDMQSSSSSLAKFVDDCLVLTSDPNDYISKEELFQSFVMYVTKEELPTKTKTSIGKNLPKYINTSDGKRSFTDDQSGKSRQETCWVGIKFQDSFRKPKQSEAKEDFKDFGFGRQ